MFLKLMESQGTDSGSRNTPRLINLDNVKEMKEYNPQRVQQKYWTVIHFIDGAQSVVEASLSNIEASLLNLSPNQFIVSIQKELL